MVKKEILLRDDPLWYKSAIIYELHVKSFFDGNNDGTGDFGGLIEKLDYLDGLGVTAIWLLPFYPSPQRDDGYDISDYFGINPDYGTLPDFKEFLKQAHLRGIRVITELVINHTSDQHPWFQRARASKHNSAYRNYYVWSDTPDKYKDARIIFKDFETSNWSWDPVAKSYYWHRFYSHQPDLNYQSPQLQKEIFRVLDFWMDMGVDGFRLDAVPYLYEEEGTNCENLTATHAFLKKLRAHMDMRFKNRMLLCEANQWPEDAASYFGKGDECHTAFNFPVMPRLFMALRMEDWFPIFDILEQTPAIPKECQWVMFLRNHDELTLEMVTDEERDYMYQVYAQDSKARINLGIRRRLSPLLDANRRKIELMNIILFSLPGTPVIYYGDELGMGDNYHLGDRNGVRTPMQWSPDRNAGFSKVSPNELFLPVSIDPAYHYESLNAENQDSNLSSLLWWMKRVIAMRKKYKAFGMGDIKFVNSDNSKVLSFIRGYEGESILVVVNLSRFSQVVKLDLSGFSGYVPEEVFSKNQFPAIKKAPYVLTLGFHDYFWLILRKRNAAAPIEEKEIPQLKTDLAWSSFFKGSGITFLEEALPLYLKGCRWFGGKARTIRKIKITEAIPVSAQGSLFYLVFFEVHYTEVALEVYSLPLAFAAGAKELQIIKDYPQSVIARIQAQSEGGVIFEGIYDTGFHKAILTKIAGRKKIKGLRYELVAYPDKKFKEILNNKEISAFSSSVVTAEQSNTSFFYENTFFLKLFRRLENSINPELEIAKFLAEKTGFSNIPPFAGAIEAKGRANESITIGLLQGLVPNQGDAWSFTLDMVNAYYERVLAKKAQLEKIPDQLTSGVRIEIKDIPLFLQELIGGVYLQMTSLLGQRTAQMHLALASSGNEPNFSPEPFSKLYQRSVFQSMASLTRKNMQFLKGRLKEIPSSAQEDARVILHSQGKIMDTLEKILQKKFSAMKIRIHGDYHLGQVLYTGGDFVIIDFEGEPARPLSERRLKRSALRDVAGMIRSFHYAAYGAFFLRGSIRQEDTVFLDPWAKVWYSFVSAVFLQAYMSAVGGAAFVPKDRQEFEILFNAFLLEKAIYELGYELNNRPNWVTISAKGIMHILETGAKEHP
ncbi:maltose alpha-D-glucosyltransferase [Candidatus Omnitrophota bacterium]